MRGALLLLSTAAFIAAGATVGARLLARARRTGELTDFLVGASLFVLSAIAYPTILAGGLGDFSLSATRQLFIASAIAMALGWLGVIAFTQRVFRPGVAWARALALGAIALLAYGLCASIAFDLRARDIATLRSAANSARWLELAAILACSWTALEGFLCWEQSRRRLAIGLADPLVVNRFLLWGVVGVCSLVSVAPSFLSKLTGSEGGSHELAALATSLGGLASAVSLQLAFLPPAAYRRWLLGAALTRAPRSRA